MCTGASNGLQTCRGIEHRASRWIEYERDDFFIRDSEASCASGDDKIVIASSTSHLCPGNHIWPPVNAFHPVDTAETAAIVAESRAVEILGHGSKRALGHTVQADTQLWLDGLDALHFYEPDEMVVSVGAGMKLSTLQTTLAEQRQRLAFEPPDWGELYAVDGRSQRRPQSIGGIVATNLSGSARLSAGAARDHLIGFKAVNGRGEVFKSGGRVVKNVTGYDLCKLMCGSFGTLAALTELVLRVLPMPEHEATLLLPGDARTTVVRFVAALGGPYETVAAAWLPASLSPNVGLEGDVGAVRLQGLEPSVRERCKRLADDLSVGVVTIEAERSATLWRALGDGVPLIPELDSALWRISMPPTQGAALLAFYPEARGWLDWAGGLIWIALPDDGDAGATSLRAHVAAVGGHATLVRASKATRERAPVFQPHPTALAALNARVKASFDPANRLNPGRIG
jgi:glycolate oxidase FAD binding subunit